MWNISDDLYLLALAVLMDLAVGEPPPRFHPTVWIGRTVAVADRLSPREGRRGLLAGALVVLVITTLWAAAAYFAAQGLREAHNLAYILADELGQPEQALPYAKRAALLSERRGASDVGMSGKWAPIFDTLGWVHARLGDFADARGELSRAVQADPQFLPAYYHLAEVYRMQGDFDQAKQFLDRVTQIISARSVSSDAAYRTKIDEASDKIRRRVSD